MTDGFVRVRQVLRRAQASGVGCHYWSVPEYGTPVEHLELLGLAKTVKSRIPACEDHGCHLLESCRHRAVFAEARAGRSGRKFRLTALGVETIDSPAGLAERVAELPLARQILELVRSASEPLSAFTLYWRLLEPELEELAETGQIPTPKLTRASVRFYLDLLVEAGWLVEDREAGTFRPA
jgi:hypothetical protein